MQCAFSAKATQRFKRKSDTHNYKQQAELSLHAGVIAMFASHAMSKARSRRAFDKRRAIRRRYASA